VLKRTVLWPCALVATIGLATTAIVSVADDRIPESRGPGFAKQMFKQKNPEAKKQKRLQAKAQKRAMRETKN
jgi:hypothetical protein